ncbi:MAG: alpha/beta hydrolase [Clostridiaceae bacterium]|nr:alpha/beta hydrolase [Clostridiaceae bacterium]
MLCFFLAVTLLSGCSETGAVMETGSLPEAEISSSQVNGNSALDQNVESGVKMTEAGAQQELIYLWEEGNIPKVTEYTANDNNQYADPPDFRPNMVVYPAKEDVQVKGVVLICSGGAFQFRNNENEGGPVAQALSELGYQCFLVNYRLRPYTQEEGALDLARAVRYVRSRAESYGIEDKDIAVMGFSAGGILCGELLLNFDGTVNGTALDPAYVPDELDQVSADAGAIAHVYSFYGRLAVASADVEKFRTSNLPPAFFVYGTRDPFVGEFEECIAALRQADVPVEDHVLQDWPHGFGAGDGKWIQDFDQWAAKIFENN